MSRALLVGVGGFLGSLARYWLTGVVQAVGGFEFPLGTLAVNVIGSFVIGLVLALSLDRGLLNAELRIFLAAGVCGGFTTMSTFSYETMALLRDGSVAAAFWNVAAQLTACLAAVWSGNLLARLL